MFSLQRFFTWPPFRNPYLILSRGIFWFILTYRGWFYYISWVLRFILLSIALSEGCLKGIVREFLRII